MACAAPPASTAAPIIASRSRLSATWRLDTCTTPFRTVYTMPPPRLAARSRLPGNVLITRRTAAGTGMLFARKSQLASADRLDLDRQLHVHFESVLVAVADAEVRAVEGPRGIGAADFLLRHGIGLAEELVDLQRDGLRDPVQRELTPDLRGSAVLEIRERALVGRGGVLRHIEHLAGLHVLVELLVTEID